MSKISRILLVEDNKDIAKMVSLNLAMMNHKVDVFDDGDEAFKNLNRDYDLAIFDIMLPGMDGIMLCKNMRKIQPEVPIFLLTSKSSELDIVAGLESGADDYLTKPFSVLELQARVKAHLRRSHTEHDATEKPTLAYNEFSIDPNSRKINVANKSIEVTAKEFELLYFLAQQPQRVFSREQLLEQIWGYHYYGSAHTVNSTINRLRAKIEPDPANPVWLKTVWGVGYKFESSEQTK